MGKTTKYNKLDKLWGQAIHLIDKKCRVCGKVPAQAHHIFTRDRKSTRFDINNGILLCATHHLFSKELSAHKAPHEFHQWLKIELGEVFLNKLMYDSHQVKKWTDEELYDLELHFKYFIEYGLK